MNQELIDKINNIHAPSSMLGIRMNYTISQNKQDLEFLKKALKKHSTVVEKVTKQNEMIQSKIRSLEYAISEQKRIETEKTLVVTNEHKKLLKHMYFEGLWHGGLVSIGVDGKRPFGNSSMYSDIANILDWELPNDDLSNEQLKKADQLLYELPFALNKIIENLN